jgi:hypothetical protein
MRSSEGRFSEFRCVEPNTPEIRDLNEHLRQQIVELGRVGNKRPLSEGEIARRTKKRLIKLDVWNPAGNTNHRSVLRQIEASARKPGEPKRSFPIAYNNYAHKQGYSRADSLTLAMTCPNTKAPVVPEKFKTK